MRIFCYVLKEYKDGFVALNVDVYELVSHITRKISTTFCVSGCIVAPTITTILLRAGWSMGNMKSRYLRY